MKMLKTFATGAALLSLAGIVNADTTFHITGSTAFRAGVIQSIIDLVGNPTEYDNSTFTSANNVAWSGSNTTYGNYKIKGSWSGSGAGVQTVAGAITTGFVPDSQITSGLNTIDYRSATGNGGEFVVPDAAMSDAFQGTTGFIGNVPTIIGGVKQAHTYSTLTPDHQVAVVTFKPMASLTFPQGTAGQVVDVTGTYNATSYSMTPQLFKATWTSKQGTPLALYTGGAMASDSNSLVYATRHNQDSGTRATYLSETGFGVTNHVYQWFPTVTSGTITGVTPYAITTINGISTSAVGNGGESSGGTVRGYLTFPFASDLQGLGGSGFFVRAR